MKKLIIGLVLLSLLLVPLAACGAEESATLGATSGGMATVDYAEEPVAEGGGDYNGDYSYDMTATTTTDTERMIVRTGDMVLVVEDINQAIEAISQMSVALGGYVVSSSVYGEEEDMNGWISFRIPDDKFEMALEQLRDLAVRVESENTYSEDVTEEYTDLESRLRNAEATEQQYLALLDKAVDVEDILSIYSYLSQIRYEIEQIKGRMQYLERTTSTSLITVYLEPEEAVVGDGWSALGVLKAAARGLVTAGKVLANILIWVAIFIPIWGTILGILLWRCHRRKAKK